MSGSVLDIFFNKQVEIYKQVQSEPNDLGIVHTELELVTTSKAVSNPLTIQQLQERYGLNATFAIEYTIEYFQDVFDMITKGQVLYLVDGDITYRIERVNLYEQFYVLDASLSVACTRSDIDV